MYTIIDQLKNFRGTWVAQSVKRPTLDSSLGLDLRVLSSGSTLGSMLGVEPTLKKKIVLSWWEKLSSGTYL